MKRDSFHKLRYNWKKNKTKQKQQQTTESLKFVYCQNLFYLYLFSYILWLPVQDWAQIFVCLVSSWREYITIETLAMEFTKYFCSFDNCQTIDHLQINGNIACSPNDSQGMSQNNYLGHTHVLLSYDDRKPRKPIVDFMTSYRLGVRVE